jgi:PAS domain S-box-containing protein
MSNSAVVTLFWVQVSGQIWLAFILYLVYRRVYREPFLRLWALSFAVLGLALALQLAFHSPSSKELITAPVPYLFGMLQFPLIALAALSLAPPLLSQRRQLIVSAWTLAGLFLLWLVTSKVFPDASKLAQALRVERHMLGAIALTWFTIAFWRKHNLAHTVGGRVMIFFTAAHALHHVALANAMLGLPPYPSGYSVVGGAMSAILPFGIAAGMLLLASQAMITAKTLLQDSEERYRTLVEASPFGIVATDSSETIVMCNRRAAEVHGYPNAAGLIGKPIAVLLASADREKILDELRSLVTDDGITRLECLMQRKDGSNFPAELTTAALRGHDLSLAGLVVLTRDITEQKQAEEALRQSQERYRVFFEQNLAGNYISTPEGAILACNPAFVHMFGFNSEKEARQTNLSSLYSSPEARDKFLQQLKQRRHLEYYEDELRRKDGSPLYVTENAIGSFSQRGELLEVHGFLVDETERKKAEQQLWQTQKMEAIGNLAGGVAHDFNNILAVIIGHGGLLVDQPDIGGTAQRHSQAILDAGRRAANLTRQLLAFSRKQLLQPRILNMNRIIEDIDKMIRRLIGDNIEMRVLLGDDLENVNADPSQMEQVILNFCVNARDAMPDGGRITIRTQNARVDESEAAQHMSMKPGRYVRIDVSDTGTGMDEETLSHIFEPFFTTKEPGKGTGLGLATVYGIVKQSGGQVWVCSEEGRGSTFSIYLPAAIREAEPRESKGKPLEMLRGSETILVVEDAPPLRALIRELLEGLGYNVLEAADGEQARGIAERNKDVALLLTDLSLPKISGLALAKSLLDKKPGLKVLYMSAHADVAALREAQEAGAGFLQKPFTQADLGLKLRNLLDSPSRTEVSKT